MLVSCFKYQPEKTGRKLKEYGSSAFYHEWELLGYEPEEVIWNLNLNKNMT